MPAHAGRPSLEEHTARLLDALGRELRPDGETDWMLARGRHHFERLLAHPTIPDYIPLLVCRFTREDVLDARRERARRPPTDPRSMPEPVPHRLSRRTTSRSGYRSVSAR